MNVTQKPSENWIEEHRSIWNKKPGLREHYETQIFDRIISQMIDGRTLQLGTGPGFFAQYHPGMVNSDISENDGIDVVADVHALQFEDASFANIVGVDVLHHFAKPGLALRECTRVLVPGGRLILVEPWAGPLGWLFFKYAHHEDCELVTNPWENAFPDDKDPMDGNAAIPISLFQKNLSQLNQHVPQLRIIKSEPFGGLSFLLTGGFQRVGLPAFIIKMCSKLESALPRSAMSFFALRAMFVLEKGDA